MKKQMMAKLGKKHQNAPQWGQGSYLVFVSHATADKWLAKTLCEKIEETGAKTFRDDRDISGGDDIPDAIRQNIVRANELVVLLTPESVDRPWVLLEVGAAWGRRQHSRIVAVLCHVQVDTIPDMIASKKAVPINQFDEYLRELRERVGRHRT
jgi:TIR domain